ERLDDPLVVLVGLRAWDREGRQQPVGGLRGGESADRSQDDPDRHDQLAMAQDGMSQAFQHQARILDRPARVRRGWRTPRGITTYRRAKTPFRSNPIAPPTVV